MPHSPGRNSPFLASVGSRAGVGMQRIGASGGVQGIGVGRSSQRFRYLSLFARSVGLGCSSDRRCTFATSYM